MWCSEVFWCSEVQVVITVHFEGEGGRIPSEIQLEVYDCLAAGWELHTNTFGITVFYFTVQESIYFDLVGYSLVFSNYSFT